jgi:hypothetical protein
VKNYPEVLFSRYTPPKNSLPFVYKSFKRSFR